MEKHILIVVDMQNDFIDGSLGTEEAKIIVPEVVKRIEYAKKYKWLICCTQDTHYDNYLYTHEGEKLPVKHCIFGTKGYELHPDVLAALKEYPASIYNKNTFGSMDLADDIVTNIRNTHTEEKDVSIELVGLCTDICVVSNALLLRAALPEARIAVNTECCAGVTPETHISAIRTMKQCQIDIL